MAFSENFLVELKRRSDIADVVSGYVNLTKRGKNLVGLCPFHGEKTPSFTLYPENGSFYCFGCGVGGDVISFIMKIENLDYVDAVKFLAARAGISIPEDDYDDTASKLRLRVLEMNRKAAHFFYTQLYSEAGKEALSYFRGRGLSENTIRKFGLGYSPVKGFELCNYLRAQGFSGTEIVAANLGVKSKTGDTVYDRFKNRVMFPIIDVRGNVVAFGGRIMTDQKPKYLNTSETMVYKKNSNLFALNFAKNSNDRRLILCEGYMDVIAVNQAGFENAVATCGTSLTVEQALLMKRYADEVVICYDADEAGQKATTRAIGIFRSIGLDIKVLTVPDGKDPDEFIRNKGQYGAEAFKLLLQNTDNDVEYKLDKLKKRYDITTTQGKIAFLSQAVKIVALLENPVERDVYSSKLANMAGVEKNSIDEQIKKLSRKEIRKESKDLERAMQANLSGRDDKINQQHFEKPRATRAEEMLIAYLTHNPNAAKSIRGQISPEEFVTDFNRKLYVYFYDRIIQNCDPLAKISADFTTDETSKIYQILSLYQRYSLSKQAADEYIDVIKNENEKPNDEKIKNSTDEEFKRMLDSLKNKRQ